MNQNRKNPLRIIGGLIWLLAFVMILVMIDGFFAKDGQDLGGYLSERFSSITGNVTKDLTGKSNSSTILRNKVVQEENAIIDVVDQVSPGVVSIIVKSYTFDFFTGPYTSEEGIGTGFVVGENGIIVTNSHVVDNPDGEYSVILKDGTTYAVDKINIDVISDLAILEIDAQGLQTVELGDSDSIKVGQTAIAIGNALGRFQNTVTVGVVSGIARELQASSGFGSLKTYEGVIQTDAALNPGNSGGPLLNSAGQVVGINVATSLGADNISFAIPINDLKPLLDSFLKEGRIIRPYLGVAYTIISPDIARLRRLPEGAFISRVVEESPAEEAGIKRGDIITEIEGQSINTDNSIAKIIAEKQVGDIVSIKIDREGNELNLTATLGEVPEE